MNIHGFKLTPQVVARLAILIALEVVLSRFLSINAWNIRIGFAFIPVVIAAMWYGPIGACAVCAIADIIGAFAFPTGPYFPGFTLTAVATGLVFGLFLYKDQSFKRIISAVVVNQLVISLVVNTYWLHLLYGKPYFFTMFERLFQCGVLVVVQTVVTYKISTSFMPVIKRMFATNGVG